MTADQFGLTNTEKPLSLQSGGVKSRLQRAAPGASLIVTRPGTQAVWNLRINPGLHGYYSVKVPDFLQQTL